MLHSSDRNKGDVAGPTGYFYYESPVSSYTTADLSINYQLQQGRLGAVGLSIRNLMNEDYVPASAQINQSLFITTSATAYKAQGRAVTLSWSKEY